MACSWVGFCGLLTSDWVAALGTWFVGIMALWLAKRANQLAGVMKELEQQRSESAERSFAMILVNEFAIARQHLHQLRGALQRAAPRVDAVTFAGLLKAYEMPRSLLTLSSSRIELLSFLKPNLATEVSRAITTIVGLLGRIASLTTMLKEREESRLRPNPGEIQTLFQMTQGHIALIETLEAGMLRTIRDLWAINHPNTPLPEVIERFGEIGVHE